jgi:hypothetical protein
MSRFSFSHLHSMQQFIVNPQQLLEGIFVDHHSGGKIAKSRGETKSVAKRCCAVVLRPGNKGRDFTD